MFNRYITVSEQSVNILFTSFRKSKSDGVAHWRSNVLLRVLMLLFIASALMISQSQAQVTESFTSIYSVNTEGNIYMIGNTNVTCAASGTCTTAQNGAAAQNNQFSAVYVDVDGDGTTNNSSTADFTLAPTGNVVFAALFWGGVSSNSSRNQVKFATPAAGYQTITGTVASSSYGYRSWADVTSLVQAGGTGTYKVGNIQLTVGGTNDFGGWSLVIVVHDNTDLFRNLNVFKGFAQVSNTDAVDIPISGFKTPPAGSINTQIGFFVFDGDKGDNTSNGQTYFRDSLKLNSTYLSNAANPVNDIFNSTISYLGSNVTTRNPAYVNTLGIDVDIMDASNILAHSDTSCSFHLTSGGETYIPSCITTSIQLFSPVMTALKFATDINGGVLQPSDTINYSIQVDNSGYDGATQVALFDTLPPHTIYIPSSLSITKGANSGTKTDGSSDDQAEYNASSNSVTFRLATGANSSTGGTLMPSETTTVAFQALVDPSTLDSTVITNTAKLTFHSLQFGTAFAHGSVPSTVIVLHPADISLSMNVANPTPEKSHLDTVFVMTSNAGSYNADSVTVNVPFPPNLLYVASSLTQGTFNPVTGVWKTGPLAAFASTTLKLVVRDTTLAALHFPGMAILDDTDKTDPDLTNNQDTVLISPIPDVTPPIFINLNLPHNGDTTNAKPLFNGTTEPDIFVVVMLNGSPIDTVISDSLGNWSSQKTTLPTGTYTIYGHAVDRVGNTKDSATHTFYVDATPPAVSIVTPPKNSHTSNNEPPITGTAEPGCTLVLVLDGVKVDSITVPPSGTWSYTPTSPLSDGPHSVTATAKDHVGNTASDTNPFTVDTVPPSIFITTPAEGSTTNNTHPPYVGRTEPGLTVVVTVDGTPVDTVVADVNGYWTATQPTALANGPHTITATTSDAAGNSANDTHHFTVNTTAPSVDVVTPANGSVTSNTHPTITGTTNPNLVVVISMDGVPFDTVTANGSGAWTTSKTPTLSSGIHTASALAKDTLGQTASDANVFTVISGTPTIVIDNPANGSIINTTKPPYVGTTQPYLKVKIKVDGVLLDSVYADVNGNWTYNQPVALANGSHTVNGTAVDALGQTATATNTFTINTAAPSIDVQTPANGSTINNNKPLLGGITNPNLSVTVKMDGVTIGTVVADGLGNWSIPQPTALADGQHTVFGSVTSNSITATDANIFYIDTTPPAITITTPANNSTTNNNKPPINGHTEPFLSVVVKMDGVPIDTVTSDGNGNWATDQPTPLSDGPHTVSATATDPAGNSATTSNNFTVDTTPPAITITNPANGSYQIAKPPINGTTDPNLTVVVKMDGVPIATVIADGTGHWSTVQPTSLSDGSHIVSATATDPAGNTASTSNNFFVDTTPPAVVIVTPPDFSHTSNPKPPITGTAEPGCTLVLVLDGTEVDSVVVGPGGTWNFTPTTPLSDGPHSVTAIAKDAAGNTATDTNPFTVDTVPPSIFITTPPEGSTTHNTEPPYVGRTEPGLTVIVKIDNTPIDTVVADPNGYWTATQPFPLGNGPHTVTATTSDAAGNTATDTHHFTVNTSAPSVDVVTPANGSVTSNTHPAITGTTNPNLVVVVSMDGVPFDTVTANGSGAWTTSKTPTLSSGIHTASGLARDTLGNTATDANVFTVISSFPTIVIDNPADGSVSRNNKPAYVGTTQPYLKVIVKVDGVVLDTVFADVNGNWSTNQVTSLSNGGHYVTGIAVDGLGQTAVATNNFTINTSAPNVDVVTPADGSTINNNKPLLSGTTDPNLRVVVKMDGLLIDTVQADGLGRWSIPQPTALSDGQHIVSGKAFDTFGNFAIDANTFTIDTHAPTVTITTPANGSIINNNKPVINGTTEPFLQVVVKMDGVPIDTVTSDGNGNWSTVQPTPLIDGPHAVNATATDHAGNSATTTNNFTIDTVPPSIVIVTPANGSTVGVNKPTYTGTTDPNLPVLVKVDGVTIGTVIANGSGNWTINQPTALADGAHVVKATATDPAGNTATDTHNFNIDTQPPIIHVVTPANGAVLNNNRPTYVGTTLPNLTVIVKVDGVPIDTVVADGSGNWTAPQPTALADGPHAVSGTVTDPYGRTSTDQHSFTIDTIPPTVIITSPIDSTSSMNDKPTVCGTTESGLTVTVTFNGISHGSVVADTHGQWCISDTTPLPEGPYQIIADAVDPGGNHSKDTVTYFVDKTPPSIVILVPANGDTTGPKPTINGTTEPNITVIVNVDGVPMDTVKSDAGGIWTTVQKTPLATGTHTASGKGIDKAGNSVTSATHTFYVDATPPAIVIVTPPDSSFTNNNKPPITGTSEPGATLILKIDGVPVDTLTVPPNGQWSFTPTTPLSDGPHNVTGTATDKFGNAATDNNPFTVDTVPPVVAITGPPDGTLTSNNKPPITGTASPGSTLVLKIDGVVVATIAVGPSGKWTYNPPNPIPDGPHTVTATATDEAGNSVTSPVDHFRIDTTPPPVALTSPAPGDTTNDNTPNICGLTDAGTRVIVKIDNVPVDTVYADSTGHWCATSPVLTDGPHSITVVAKDSAGNSTTLGPTGTGFRINTKPAISSIGPSSRLLCDGDLNLTVNGKNFFPNSVIQINGVNQTTTYVDSSKLTATILSTFFTSAGSYSVTIYTPPPGGGTSVLKPLTVNGATTYITGTVYYDRNMSSTKEPNEPGISGWTVTLVAPNPVNNQTTTTLPGGLYTFNSLFPGTHTVTVTPPTGWNPVSPGTGSATASVSCGSAVTGVNFGYSLADTTADTGSYRTFNVEDLLVANAIKKDCHMLRWNFTFHNDNGRAANGLYVEFNNVVTRWFTYDPFPSQDNLGQNNQDFIFSGATVQDGDAIQFAGYSEVHPCVIRVGKWWWLYNDSSTAKYHSNGPLLPDSIIKYLPMPNVANVRDEVFRQVFTPQGGELVGSAVPWNKKNFAWVVMRTGKDLLLSLRDNTGEHTGRPRGFTRDVSSAPDLKGLLRQLPPRKHNNKLFADLAILQFNIAASSVGITPTGFGELIYDDGLNPFSGLMIKNIAGQADTAMTYWRGRPESYYIALDTAIEKINNAFDGPVDTISFAIALKLTGVKPLSAVPFLRANPGVSVTRITPGGQPDFINTNVPETFELYQNYPNPFNPTTTINFMLPGQAAVTLKIYDILGKEVMTLYDRQTLDEGAQSIQFNASNLPSGVYFYRMSATITPDDENDLSGKTFVQTKKMMLIK